MSKLQMPKSSFIGTPLSEDELKAIVGGNVDVERTCICTFKDSSGNITKASMSADSELVCSEKCYNECAKNGSCVSSTYSYSASN